jgi:hypothetical protein
MPRSSSSTRRSSDVGSAQRFGSATPRGRLVARAPRRCRQSRRSRRTIRSDHGGLRLGLQGSSPAAARQRRSGKASPGIARRTRSDEQRCRVRPTRRHRQMNAFSLAALLLAQPSNSVVQMEMLLLTMFGRADAQPTRQLGTGNLSLARCKRLSHAAGRANAGFTKDARLLRRASARWRLGSPASWSSGIATRV